MKRTFVTLISVTLLGLASGRAEDGFSYHDDDELETIVDIDDDTRDELDREQDYELDTLKGADPVIKTTYTGKVPCIYDMPYSISGNYPNYHRLAANTALLIGGGLTALVVLDMLPENATNWNKEEEMEVPTAERYYKNIMIGPHWDHDNPLVNYILHPYAGAAYFMSARSQGFNMWYSLLYSTAISTIFWEFGVEAFNEQPSIQDLFVTPLCGCLIGEGFYRAKRYIVEHDYRLLGWKPLGYVTAFLCDPVNECLGYFRGNRAHGWTQRHGVDINSSFTITPDGHGGQAPTLAFSLTF